jgi:SAM-dependent methyltransferase
LTHAGLFNRPMLESDLAELATNPVAAELRALVRRYRDEALPVVNGSFAYSNLLEGNDQALTCHPYRLWEYASLFGVPGLLEGKRRFADVGGAGAPLAYLLAERGHPGLAIDLQPFAVDLCNYVASVRSLPLEARVGDVTSDFADRAGQFDLVTCISVIEHVPPAARPRFLAGMARLLRPGGMLYLTFDYGSYRVAESTYHRHEPGGGGGSESLSDLDRLCEAVAGAGFRFPGNDPRSLPPGILSLQAAPGRAEVMHRRAMNLGPVDGATPWPVLLKYLARRVFRIRRRIPSRFDRHNFFRMILERA